MLAHFVSDREVVLPSSPSSQPMTLSILMGSGPVSIKALERRLSLPSGRSAKTNGAPHSGHVGR